MTEDLFLKKLVQQDPLSWKGAFDELYPIAFRATKAGSLNLSAADAEDVAAETLREIHSKVDRVDTYDGLKALTVTIARRRGISLVRKKTAAKRGGDKTAAMEDSPEIQIPDGAPTPAEEAEEAELILVVRDFMQQLEGKVGKVVECYFVQDLSYMEIAEKLGISIGSVGNYIARGVERLKNKLVKDNPALMVYFRNRPR